MERVDDGAVSIYVDGPVGFGNNIYIVVDRTTGEVMYGRVPPYSVVVSGTMPGKALPDGTPGPGLYCAVIVKRVDAGTRSKTAINELLRT